MLTCPFRTTTLHHKFNGATGFQGQPEQPVTLVHDTFNWLSVIRNLKPTDTIVLLTPVIIPANHGPAANLDPFECFGKAMKMYHHKIRHIPYTIRQGITSTHIGFIKRATVIVFVMSETPLSWDGPQIHAALVTQKAVDDERPVLNVLTCRAGDLQQFYEDFPTIIQSKDYMEPTLVTTASFIFGKDVGAKLPLRKLWLPNPPQPKLWSVEQWEESRDIDRVYDLWTQSMDVRFALRVETLASLLYRPGYARHYVVRATDGQLLGFCATFLSYVDQAGEQLIASLAILLVDREHQCLGIGLSLHNHAIDHLKRIRGVSCLRLGSTFPRILYGPSFYMEFDQTWFSRRGWRLDRDHPGQGQPVYDMLLDFDDWIAPAQDWTMNFRNCTQNDMDRVLEVVKAEVMHEEKMGWFDQYSKLIGDFNVKDIVVAVLDGLIVAVALTYTPSSCSPISLDLPWAGEIGSDVGGVTCICIPRTLSLFRHILTDNSTFVAAKRDVLMIPLLHACIRKLQDQAMKKMFLDAVSSNVEGFRKLGEAFQVARLVIIINTLPA